MMNEQQIEEQYRQTCALLDEQRLKEALAMIDASATACNDWSTRQQVKEVDTAYQYMLQYMAQGVNDPQRHKLYKDLLAKAYHAADMTHLLLLDPLSGQYYYQQRRTQARLPQQSLQQQLHVLEQFDDDLSVYELMPNNQKQLTDLLKKHEDTQRELFLNTWTNPEWSAQEAAEAHTFLLSKQLRAVDLSLFVSAVTLSVLTVFDRLKVVWLLNAYKHTDTQVSLRALTGIVLIANQHAKRIRLYPSLTSQLARLDENGALSRDLQTCYLKLLLSKDTERVHRKLRDEIMPEVMKNIQKMQDMASKMGIDELIEDDQNPDWQFKLQDMALGDKMEELDRMQREGADVYLQTFAQTKQLPFFQDLHNWFMPYDARHSAAIRCMGFPIRSADCVTLDIALSGGMFCNSDSYSAIFLMEHLPAEQRKMMINQMSSGEVQELLRESNRQRYAEYGKKSSIICRNYVQDLYRFFKLNRYRAEFHDPFNDPLQLQENEILRPYLLKGDTLRAVADFRFMHEQLPEAYKVYKDLADLGEATCEVFQRMAYCLQKGYRYDQAIECLERANELQADNVWTLRHLGYCHRCLGNHAQAYDYYSQAATLAPGNLDITSAQGNCLIALERYTEALNCFFKIDLAKENNLKALRPIAWCSFLSGKMEQAQKYYQRVIALKPTANDYLNAGHVAWAMGNLSEAIGFYREASKRLSSPAEFRKLFLADEALLKKKGIDDTDLHILPDLL